MQVRRMLIAGAVAAMGGLASIVQAQAPQAAAPQAPAGATQDAARLLASGCASCHGTQGRAQSGSLMLAGLDRTYFVQQMQSFKSGARPATVMHQIAKGYTDADIEALAGYFSGQRR